MLGKTSNIQFIVPSALLRRCCRGKRDARGARRSIGMVEQAQGLEQMGAQQRVQELGAPQWVQEVPRAQQQVLERGARPAREHHGTPPPLVMRQLPPLVLGLLPLLLLPLLLVVLVVLVLVLLLQAARRHAVCDSLQETCSHHHQHHKNPPTPQAPQAPQEPTALT